MLYYSTRPRKVKEILAVKKKEEDFVEEKQKTLLAVKVLQSFKQRSPATDHF